MSVLVEWQSYSSAHGPQWISSTTAALCILSCLFEHGNLSSWCRSVTCATNGVANRTV